MSMAPWTELLASGTSWSKGVGTKLAQLSPLTPTFGTPLAWMGTRSEKVAAQELQGEEEERNRGFRDYPPHPRGSPKPRKHISNSTKSRCARRLGSQRAGSVPGAARAAGASLPVSSGPFARSPRVSSSSSSIGWAVDGEARAATTPGPDRIRGGQSPAETAVT